MPRLGDLPGEAPWLSIHGPGSAERWHWAAFWGLAARYRHALEAMTAPGEVVAIIGRTGIGPVALLAGAIAGGRLPTILPPPHPIQDSAHYQDQQRAALRQTGARAVCVFEDATEAALLATVPEAAALVHRMAPCAPDAVWQDTRDAFAARLDGGRHPAVPLFVQHSSGTTGLKKAVAVTPALLRAQYAAYWQGVIQPLLAPAPSVVSWLPLYHDMGLVAGLLLPLLAAAPLALVDPFDWVARPQMLPDVIEAERPSLCWMPNFAFRHQQRLRRVLARRDLSSVRAWINCSEPCRAADAESFEASFADWGVRPGSVLGCYAMAEAVFAVTQALPGPRRVLQAAPGLRPGDAVSPLAGPLAGPLAVQSAGPPLPGVQITAFVEGRPVPPGIYGEIGLRAPSLFDGYRGMTPAESGLLPDGTFLTGDLGVVLEGEVFILGRAKDIVIVNGRNIAPADVEAAVASVPGVSPGRCVAFGTDNPVTGSEDLVILAEAAAGAASAALVPAITRLVQALFHCQPRVVRLVPARWLVKSTSGKLSRTANRAKYLRGQENA